MTDSGPEGEFTAVGALNPNSSLFVFFPMKNIVDLFLNSKNGFVARCSWIQTKDGFCVVCISHALRQLA